MSLSSPRDNTHSSNPIPARPRAPTISIDASAISPPLQTGNSVDSDKLGSLPKILTEGLETKLNPSSTLATSPTDFRDSSRPTSPHNTFSPSSKFFDGAGPQNFLAVPQARSRGNSIESVRSDRSDRSGESPSSYGGDTYAPSSSSATAASRKLSFNNAEIINDEQALNPDPSTEDDFTVNDNKFAFSPGQLNKLVNPKSLSAFYALGGVAGLEKGLRTNRYSGLSVDEVGLDGTISFAEAVQAGATAEEQFGRIKKTTTSTSMARPSETSKDAYADRKRIFKDNRLPEKKAKSIWRLAWIAYNDKILILLTVAAVVSLALGIYQTLRPPPGEEHEAHVQWVEGVAIVVAIVIVTVVGALNDYQKERQFIKLNKKKEERFVKVIRSGKSQEISVYEVLVGDVMHLEPGDLIPVDGIFLEGYGVKCDESSATGESDLLRKTPGDEVYHAIHQNQSLAKLDPFILSGAKVSEGTGLFLVTSVGVNSSYGKTLMSLHDEGQTTPLQSKLNVLAEYIAKLGLAAGLLLFVVLFIKFLAQLSHIQGGSQAKGQQFLQIFIVAVTIIVVAVPEGLPLAVTLALAFATTRMMRDNNLVRILRSCETMGNATTICSDKTGTLTQNVMTVVAGAVGTTARFDDSQAAASAGGTARDHDAELVQPSSKTLVSSLSSHVRELLKDSIVLNSTAFEAEEQGKITYVGSKTETSLLSFADEHLGIAHVTEERANADIVQMVPFDSGRKCMAVVQKVASGKYRMLVKGASEILIAQCTKMVVHPTQGLSEEMITPPQVEVLKSTVSSYASRSLRTIALLYRDFDKWPPRGAASAEEPKSAEFDKVFKEMTFLAVIGIQDPLRPGVTAAVRQCQTAGVFVRMVTGDNLMTAKAIASECGIFTAGGIAMEGPAFRKLGSRQRKQVIPRLQVLARSSPADKKLLVVTLKQMGETVAVTGDGTNDAPALQAADVGFSMGIAGTEVAKEASAIILMDDNFASIVKAISWGRAVNDAVKKFLQFQITVNITAVVLTFVSAVANNTETSVLNAVQLLWVNLIMDTFAALALATDAPLPSVLERKPEPKSAPLITLTMWKMIMGQAIYQLVVTFVLNFAGAAILNYSTPTQMRQLGTLVFNTFVWMQIFNQYNCRRLDQGYNIFEGMFRNYWFLGIQLVIVGGQLLIVFVGGAAFGVTPLNGTQWAISVILGLLSMPIAIVIRLFPDELLAPVFRCLPQSKKRYPTVYIEDEDDRLQQWNPALENIRDELAFLKRIRGGRMAELSYKLHHPKEVFLPRSRSTSHSRERSNSDIPRTPEGEATTPDLSTVSPQTPERVRRRTRSSSNFGAATAMAGIIAGSVAGGWSPAERRSREHEPLRFNRSRASSALDATVDIEIHPDTREDDPVIREPVPHSLVPPSQNPDLSPFFEHSPGHKHTSSTHSHKGTSHTRHSSTEP